MASPLGAKTFSELPFAKAGANLPKLEQPRQVYVPLDVKPQSVTLTEPSPIASLRGRK